MAGKSNKPIVLSHQEKQFIDGCLLGDGHITPPRGRSCQFTYITSIKGHAEYVYQNLKRLAVGECKNGPVRVESYDKRTRKTYISYRFRTTNNLTFYNLRQRWYPQGVKVIPPDVKLTPTVLLMWYVGDGSVVEASRSYYIKLSTHAFDKGQVESILFPQIQPLEPSFQYDTDKVWVYIPRRHMDAFFDTIGKCPIPEYHYKWEYAPYKREAFKNGTATDFSKIQESLLTDYQKGDTMWALHKKYGVEYNLIKYHLRKLKLL